MGMPESVLIAEDEEHIRLLLRKLLASLGINEIREAREGGEACRMYGETPSDFVVMDINMPGMNGLDALQRITDADADAVVIMLTSLGTRQAVEESAARGATYFIRKDTPLSEMRAKIAEVLMDVFGEEGS